MTEITLAQGFLEMLRCPISNEKLSVADASLVQQVTQAIDQGVARDKLEQKIALPIEGGLVNETGNWLHQIRNGIPTLVAEEAIKLDELHV